MKKIKDVACLKDGGRPVAKRECGRQAIGEKVGRVYHEGAVSQGKASGSHWKEVRRAEAWGICSERSCWLLN